MLFLKLLRKFGKLIRGGAASRQIFLGALLGVMIGIVPGLNLTLLGLIFLLLLLNAHVGIAVLGMALGRAACLLLAPWTFRVGHVLIHGVGLEGMFRAASDAPVLALLDLHVYCLTGGAVVGLALGTVFGVAMVQAVRGLRLGVVRAARSGGRVVWLANNPLLRFFMWLVFGRLRGGLADMLRKRPRLFRKSGLKLAVVGLLIAAALEAMLLDRALRIGIERGLAAATGAEVNVAEADLSLLHGRIDVRGLQATDPERPTHNMLEVEKLTAELNVSDLLRKRYVIDLLALSNARTGTERESPGRVFRQPEEPPAGERPSLTDYLEKARKFREYLPRLKEYLERRKLKQEDRRREAEEEKKRQEEQAVARGYLALSAKDIIADRPTWVIRKVSVEGLVLPFSEGPRSLEITDLTSHPEFAGRPTVLRMFLPGAPDVAMLRLHFEAVDLPHELKLDLRDIPLGRALRLSERAPVDVTDGRASLRLDGTFSADSLSLPFTLKVQGLSSAARQGRSPLGLDPGTASQIFQSLEGLTLAGDVTGSVALPMLRIDAGKTLAGIKDALLAAGKKELANRAGKQIAALQDRLKKELGEELMDRLPIELPEGLRLPGLGGLKPDEETDEDDGEKEDEDKKPGAGDLLKGLF